MEWASLIAIIVIPIFAVLVGQWLQNRSEKRKDKMRVFTHLMSYRLFGYVDQTSVNILNSVPIVFYNDNDVIIKYKEYMKSLNIRKEDVEQRQKEIEDNKTKMLMAMAKALKYEKIDWEVIQNPYIPNGLVDALKADAIFRQGQLGIAKLFANMDDPKMSMEAIREFGVEIENRISDLKNSREDKK